MKFFIDTEFIEDGRTIELLSIGVIADDGREFYQEVHPLEVRGEPNEWVKANVLPHMQGEAVWNTRPNMALDLIAFVGATTTHRPEFWAYYGDYDWVAVCQLFGRMIDLPEHWPMFCMDLKQLCVSVGDPRLPKQATAEHHALADARWTRDAYEFLTTATT